MNFVKIDWYDDNLKNICLKKIKKIFLPKNMQKIELCIFKSINEEKEIRKWIKKYI
jgi:hypothetical protein